MVGRIVFACGAPCCVDVFSVWIGIVEVYKCNASYALKKCIARVLFVLWIGSMFGAEGK